MTTRALLLFLFILITGITRAQTLVIDQGIASQYPGEIAISHKNDYIAYQAFGVKTCVFNAKNGKKLHELTLAKQGEIYSDKALDFSPVANHIAVLHSVPPIEGVTKVGCESTFEVGIWNVETGQLLKSVVVEGSSTFGKTLKYSPDGKLIAFATVGKVEVINARTGKVMYELKHEPDPNRYSSCGVSWSKDSKYLVNSCSDKKTACLWAVDSRKQIGHYNTDAAVFRNGSSELITKDQEFMGGASVWNATKQEKTKEIPLTQGRSFDIDPKGNYLISGDYRKHIYVYNFSTDKVDKIERIHFAAGICDFVISTDGQYVVVVGNQSEKEAFGTRIEMWPIDTLKN